MRRVAAWKVATAIEILRKRRAEIAALLGCSLGTVGNYERGDTPIPLPHWMLIERELRGAGLLEVFNDRLAAHESVLRARRAG